MATDTEEFPPLLPAGFHEFDVGALRRLCVDRFPASLSRARIMAGFEEVLSLLQRNQIRGEVWVDGSFTTEKLNPGDVDILLVVDISDVASFNADQRQCFDWFASSNLKPNYACDTYAMVRDPSDPRNDWLLAYWLRQFGFSRTTVMKGLALVRLPFVVVL